MSKIIALYLPQFHEIKENNEWWGKGFTEWTNVKEAKKYSKYQRQPRVPLDNNYYDLSEYEGIKYQVDIANKYGIDGFCIYHYYSVGQKLLERPSEVILENKDLAIQFFFSWANHDWRRVWASSSKEMLRKQEYGNKSEIKKHFLYLLKFFKDERYIKIENKPVLSIYQDIEEETFKLIYEIFNSEAINNGFGGIYWIGTMSSKDTKFSINMNNYFRFEPNFSKTKVSSSKILYQKIRIKFFDFLNEKLSIKVPMSLDYLKMSNQIYSSSLNEKSFLLGYFTGWDNTPRYKHKGYYYKNETLEVFSEYFEKIYRLSVEKEDPFFIINAWNEWGEGAYLEPDTYNGFSYLEEIKNIKDKIGGYSIETKIKRN